MAASLLLLVAGFNILVDPYGLFRLVDAPAFNATKPTSGAHGAMVKAYQVLRVDPAGLILGNSRAEVGFDPLVARSLRIRDIARNVFQRMRLGP